jgi:hypothetical protein
MVREKNAVASQMVREKNAVASQMVREKNAVASQILCKKLGASGFIGQRGAQMTKCMGAMSVSYAG